MAQIDTSIYGQLKPVQIDSPMNALMQVSQVQNAQRQNKLAELALGEKERETAADNALAGLIAQGKSSADIAKELAGQGYGKQSIAYTKQAAEMQKQQREAEKAQLSMAIDKQKIVAQYAGAAKDQASWEQGLQELTAMGVDVSKVPPQFSPQTAELFRNRALTGAQQLEQVWKQKQFDLDVDKFGYQQQNDAANRNVTIRGHNLTDARGREANALKLDENNIKRTEKKATDDLTKNSQVASFDTMLGTLDRLGTHKGLSRSVGMMSAFPTRPGSDSANFQAELNTFQSQAFLPMVAQLKGMGALSDAEGKKLTAAVGALDPSMSKEAFEASIGRIKADMEAARARVAGAPRNKAPDAPIPVNNEADYAKVPSGATYIDPNGKTRRKP